MITQNDVINFILNNNSKPNKRSSSIAIKWQELLIPNQYKITDSRIQKHRFLKPSIVFFVTRFCLRQFLNSFNLLKKGVAHDY